ncbi:xylulokinase [Salibacterium halotolerans]|uniref:Xylulokinase n=1 Tax=Salibacterium halotolerans TaxID=1884432 RepID=A0A1I5LAD7_9BACI|nr:FGGY family carbohydrate kinase [Salibacterium halotolerans]SFO94329.1 xylulokinase [Salibacterium halotolerans]
MSHVVGVDIGTSGIKIGTVDDSGSFVLHKHQPYILHYENGKVEINAEYLWGLVQDLLVETAEEIQRHGGKLESIALSSFCHASVFLDSRGCPLRNGIMYMDKRGENEAEELKSKLSYRDENQIKNRIDPGMTSVVNLMWVKQHEPDIFGNTYYWGHISSYILFRLTGTFVMDWTQASFTGIFSISDYCWSESILKKADLDKEILPSIVNPREQIGVVEDVDTALDGTTVIAGGADTACASLAIGLKPNEMFESAGTSNVLTVCTTDTAELDTRLLNRCHVLENQWLSHGPMSTPGASIDWFYKEFLDDVGDKDKKDILNDYAKGSSPGANGVYFLPYMHGERAPVWDPYAQGVFFGLDLTTTKADMLQAVYEGCAFGLKQIYEIIREKYTVKNISSFSAIGGGAKNTHWGQIKADVLYADISVKEISEAAAYGACLIASRGAGLITSFEEKQIRGNCFHLFEPSAINKTLYEDEYAFFVELYPALQLLFQKRS